uniref:Uncharacterized protein n=1 Tax=Nonomuraea gerenzanensis TaxID=93944 RepID=A0A1M4E3N4_9ACTN|nr:hypothetical protein BN4615_P2947 [Nonomuraea gerenzanensis]
MDVHLAPVCAHFVCAGALLGHSHGTFKGSRCTACGGQDERPEGVLMDLKGQLGGMM